MPNNENRQDSAFAKYDAMSTEELQQILREDASKTEGEGSDMETILYVMEVLAKRRKEQNEGVDPEEALESFKSKYYKPNDNSFISECVTMGRKKRIHFGWSRGLVAAVMVLVIILGSSLTANAIGFDLFEVIAKWTKETFHLGYVGQSDDSNEPSPNHANPCKTLHDTLLNYGLYKNVIPSWLPEGYAESEIKIDETPVQRRFTAKYQYGENTIRIRIVDYLSGAPYQVEQSDALLEVYDSYGIKYYILENNDQLQVAWTIDNLECTLSGPVSLSEIKMMIDSIGKG